jgi:hypothetical protein
LVRRDFDRNVACSSVEVDWEDRSLAIEASWSVT